MHNSNPANKYLYNGKELQDNTGYYDYGFRQLDPALGRWFVQDALAEKYKSVSAYAYVKNNPINAVDIAGLAYMPTPVIVQGNASYAGTSDLLGFLGVGTSLGTSGPTGEDYDEFISMGGGGDGSSFSEWYSLTGEDILRDVQWSLTGSMARAWFKKFFWKPSINVGDPTVVRVSEEASPTIPPGKGDYLKQLAHYLYTTSMFFYPYRNPFKGAVAISGDIGGVLVGGEYDVGGAFILVGKNAGEFVAFDEKAGGVAYELSAVLELARIDYTGKPEDFTADMLFGDRKKYWISGGEGFNVGVAYSKSDIVGRGSDYVYSTSVSIGFGFAYFLISGGYNTGTISPF